MSNKGKKVKTHYRGTLDDGTQFDSSYDRGEPLEFTCGAGQMIKGFDAAVIDMQVGEKKSVHIPAADAYGEHNPEMVITFPAEQVPNIEQIEKGMKLFLSTPSGMPVPAVVMDVTPEAVEQGRRYIDERRIAIALKEAIGEKLYIEVEVAAAGHSAAAVIAGGHTRFVSVTRDGETLLDRRTPSADAAGEEEVPLTFRRVWDFAMTAPAEELRFILETSRVNKAAAERSLAGEFGHCVGRTLRCDRERRVMGDSIFTRVLSYTSAACDARMAGAMIPVMSNSGSGNQGIAATLPVAVYAEETHASEERMIRALTLSHLTVIYIKQSLGRLSALCGCVAAATGSSCGVTYLMGGGYAEAAAAVKNMIANLTGMICDGAKPSCDEAHERRLDGSALGDDGHGRSLRDAGGGDHRGGRGQVHPQSDGHRPRRHE